MPVIYVLNLGRNLFVISSFGNQWFQIMPDTVAGWTGEPVTYTSFFWAHNVIAETGSLIALVVISYAVMTKMPELLSHLMDILDLIKIENIKKMLKGQEVLAKPLQRVK
jgi:archaeosortase A (PGF-CTERM-specific)